MKLHLIRIAKLTYNSKLTNYSLSSLFFSFYSPWGNSLSFPLLSGPLDSFHFITAIQMGFGGKSFSGSFWVELVRWVRYLMRGRVIGDKGECWWGIGGIWRGSRGREIRGRGRWTVEVDRGVWLGWFIYLFWSWAGGGLRKGLGLDWGSGSGFVLVWISFVF